MEEARHLSSFGMTEKIKIKNPAFHLRGSVGSPTSVGHEPIEVNIYGRTFLML